MQSRDTSVSFFWIAKEGYLIDVEASNIKDTTGTIPIRGVDVTWITDTPVSVAVQVPGVPMEYTLFQNFPNPFNPSTTITFRVPSFGFVSLKIFDVLGREVATLVDEEKEAGTYAVSFDTRHSELGTLSSGTYFYRLRAGEVVQIRTMTLLR